MTEEQPADFSAMLRRARRAAGLSQEELAERAGLSARAVSALERGVNRAPRRDTLDMLADALDLSPNERRRWEQVRREQAVRADAKPAGVTQRNLPGPPNNLPAQPTRFFGRSDERTMLTSMLGEQEIRLVTLTGPGGSGKTRLALEVAESLLVDYLDGVFFVDLAPINDVNLVLPAVATVLGLRPRTDQPPLTTLIDWLRDKHLLLVLDNLEQILDAASDIAELLARCPELRVVATSRAPLRLRAEREVPVAPLPLPPTDPATEAETVARYDVVRLFVDRARAGRPDFAATGDEALVVARICQRLDGLPLAIELTAACVRLFPPRAILARLEQHLPLVASSHRDAPARQRTLRDTIAWSYDLLQPDVQALLRRLSLFKGGWTLEAAEAVARNDELDILSGSATLIEHSLIQTREWLDGSPRFSMLETIREFGIEQLDMLNERSEAHRRHAEFFLRLFSNSERHQHSHQSQDWLRHGDAEIENVRLALEWAIDADPQLALRLAREFSWIWHLRVAYRESLDWIERAITSVPDIPEDLRAGSLFWIAEQATTIGDFEKASGAQEEALAIYRKLHDGKGAADCLAGLARIAFWSADFDQAVVLYEDAAALYRRHDSGALPITLGSLGWALILNGKLDHAARVLDEAFALSEHGGPSDHRTVIANAQGQLALELGDMSCARRKLKLGIQFSCDVGDPRKIAQAIEARAWLAATDKDAVHVATVLGAVSMLRDAIGVPIQPWVQRFYDRYVPIARAQLSDDEWERAWSNGCGLSRDDAIDLALEGLE